MKIKSNTEDTVLIEKMVNLSLIEDDKFVEKFVNNDLSDLKKEFRLDKVEMATGDDANLIFGRILQTPVDIEKESNGFVHDVWEFIRNVRQLGTKETVEETNPLEELLSAIENAQCVVIVFSTKPE